jgi:hypothetical protein
LNKSSTSQFTVIVGFIPLFPDSRPFEIGVYHGYSKAENSNTLLSLDQFRTEVVLLFDSGFEFHGENVKVEIAALICDAPARATVTGTKSHSFDFHLCSKCTGSGVNKTRLEQSDELHRRRCSRRKLGVL